MMCLNRIHRVPIIQFDENYAKSEARKQQGTLLYVLSLRNVFTQTVVKLSNPNPSLCSHIKQKTVCERRVGTWTRVQTVRLFHTTPANRDLKQMLELKAS
ncbi:unnamed protein product [Haemonchus placei]|uniref:Uncharacterized protein n=1 Tax=Haemonchus placei TaxID=6290 RepID=A0A0N4W2E5_HAEPC|nr:unnamed protein product [Haemonchus placei]